MALCLVQNEVLKSGGREKNKKRIKKRQIRYLHGDEVSSREGRKEKKAKLYENEVLLENKIGRSVQLVIPTSPPPDKRRQTFYFINVSSKRYQSIVKWASIEKEGRTGRDGTLSTARDRGSFHARHAKWRASNRSANANANANAIDQRFPAFMLVGAVAILGFGKRGLILVVIVAHAFAGTIHGRVDGWSI